MRLLLNKCLWILVGAVLPSSVTAQTVTRVEEDWELVLGVPSPIQDSPQISTWMSPTGSLDDEHFAADFNHAQRPDFSSGGFQVKAFDGEVLVSDRLSDSGDNLDVDYDVVTWTQSLTMANNSLEFSIENGRSDAWGNFGNGSMKVRFQTSPVTSLNDYSYLKSVEWAGVGFGGNRVESFTLKRVRIYVGGSLYGTFEVNLRVQ